MMYQGADPTAVMGRRIGAYLIDVVLAAIVVLAILIPLWQSNSVTAPSGTVDCTTDDNNASREVRPGVQTSVDFTFCFDNGSEVRYIPEAKERGFAVTSSLVSGATALVMLVLLQGLVGGSPGKLLLGLRVVKEDGSNAGIGRCLVRTILLPIDFACCAIIGLLTAFNSQRHRRVGDMVASTMVISRSDQDSLVLAGSGQSLPGSHNISAQQWSSQNQPAPPSQSPSAWSTPSSSPAPPAPPAAPAPEGGPTWDPARNSYVQYDQARGAWMQYDDGAKQWKALDT